MFNPYYILFPSTHELSYSVQKDYTIQNIGIICVSFFIIARICMFFSECNTESEIKEIKKRIKFVIETNGKLFQYVTKQFYTLEYLNKLVRCIKNITKNREFACMFIVPSGTKLKVIVYVSENYRNDFNAKKWLKKSVSDVDGKIESVSDMNGIIQYYMFTIKKEYFSDLLINRIKNNSLNYLTK